MKVTFDLEPEMCLYGDLKAGDCFSDSNSNSVYMKIALEKGIRDKDWNELDKKEYYMAVNLVTGKIVNTDVFNPTTKVKPQRSAIVRNLER